MGACAGMTKVAVFINVGASGVYIVTIYVSCIVANAITGVDVKFADWDYSPMLPRVCSLFACHIKQSKEG